MFLVRYRTLWRYPAKQARLLATIIAVTVMSAAASALQPLPMKMLIDNGLGSKPLSGGPAAGLNLVGLGDASPRVIVAVAAFAAFVLSVMFSALGSGLGWLWESTGQRLVSDVMIDLHGKLQRLSRSFHLRNPVGDLLSRIQWDSQSIYTAVSAVFVSPIIHVITTLLVGFAAWRQSPHLAIVVLAMAPILAGTTSFFGPRLRERAAASRQSQSAVTSFVTQVMHAMPVVQSFTSEERNLETFRALSGRAVANTRRESFLGAIAETLGQMVSTVGAAVVLVVGGREVMAGSMTVGGLLVFVAYLRTLEAQAQGLMEIYRSLRSAEAMLDRVVEVLESGEEVVEAVHPVSLPMVPGGSSVVFEEVSFGYEVGRPVLSGVSLRVEPGQRVALVGRSGAGKTTLVSLVPRFFDPQSGRVLIDGVDIRDVRLRDVRERVSVVRQDPILLPVSVAENIAYGRPSASRADVEEAAEEALAAGFIRDLPDGFDTVVGERGASLSGGQQQRLAIARAFLKDAPILILDEPTSALDAESESLLVKAIERLTMDRTVLVIAHRLSTVRNADVIVVMDEGRIVESGSHGELVARGGAYAQFHQLQLIGAIR